MKFSVKRFLTVILLSIYITGCGNTPGKAVFAVEEITAEQFSEAARSNERYDDTLFQDSVIANDITAKIIQHARNRFERLDSIDKEDYDIEAMEYDKVFSINSLIYAKSLGMYCVQLPTIHDSVLYCYDSESGEYLGDILYPFAVSPDGIIAAQKGYDCDWPLDLYFYKRTDNFVYEHCKFKTLGYYSETIMDNDCAENWNLPTETFWVGNNTLYISMYGTPGETDLVYLKITVPD